MFSQFIKLGIYRLLSPYIFYIPIFSNEQFEWFTADMYTY